MYDKLTKTEEILILPLKEIGVISICMSSVWACGSHSQAFVAEGIEGLLFPMFVAIDLIEWVHHDYQSCMRRHIIVFLPITHGSFTLSSICSACHSFSEVAERLQPMYASPSNQAGKV